MGDWGNICDDCGESLLPYVDHYTEECFANRLTRLERALLNDAGREPVTQEIAGSQADDSGHRKPSSGPAITNNSQTENP